MSAHDATLVAQCAMLVALGGWLGYVWSCISTLDRLIKTRLERLAHLPASHEECLRRLVDVELRVSMVETRLDRRAGATTIAGPLPSLDQIVPGPPDSTPGPAPTMRTHVGLGPGPGAPR
jgi:hypothetical protein